eukprot:gnl/TRDRNA2_/TRDRNA2_181078_c0_seq1.p1 gnl/TRDRNA2_/TRDRNA2_181078_c0~~gnl/TRDRNA2_/TRDRNA2_181078_c0_seq1.p1  ORF type:complete len:467 (+),score=95.21 gnl/TRDRNA2_/TRDRNA2_181078_c0_seq1:191-1591(+)
MALLLGWLDALLTPGRCCQRGRRSVDDTEDVHGCDDPILLLDKETVGSINKVALFVEKDESGYKSAGDEPRQKSLLSAAGELKSSSPPLICRSPGPQSPPLDLPDVPELSAPSATKMSMDSDIVQVASKHQAIDMRPPEDSAAPQPPAETGGLAQQPSATKKKKKVVKEAAPTVPAAVSPPEEKKAKPEEKKTKKKKSQSVESSVACPSVRVKPEKQRVSRLKQIADRKAEFEARKHEYDQLVDDIIAGKYKKEGGRGGGQPAGNMLIVMPTPYERDNTRRLILAGFREKYSKMGKETSAAMVEQYDSKQTQGLKIEGGHRPMRRPDDVKLPADFRKSVGVITPEKLAEHDCANLRKLVCVYGDVFDVSDRPDKYGEDGPYAWMSGTDITWGLLSGKDVPEQVNHYYDCWKIAPKEYRDRKLQGLLAWVAFYEYEYGLPVGQLDKYTNEAALKGPPMETAEECSIM